MDDFESEFAALHALAYRVAYRLLGSREDSEDVALEALARTGIRWKRLVRGGAVDGWVVRVAGRLAIDVWRRRRTRARTPLDPPAPTLTVESPAVERIVLHEQLERLPRRQREVVVMRYLGDLPEEAVARALGCSTGAVKQHASRGLATLRAALGAEGAHDVRAS